MALRARYQKSQQHWQHEGNKSHGSHQKLLCHLDSIIHTINHDKKYRKTKPILQNKRELQLCLLPFHRLHSFFCSSILPTPSTPPGEMILISLHSTNLFPKVLICTSCIITALSKNRFHQGFHGAGRCCIIEAGSMIQPLNSSWAWSTSAMASVLMAPRVGVEISGIICNCKDGRSLAMAVGLP